MTGRSDGFTLVELLVVVVVLGILTTVTIAGVNGITTRAEDTTCDVEARTARTAVELLKVDAGTAGALAILDAADDPAATPPTDGLEALVPEYLDTVPALAAWDPVTDEVVGAGRCA